MAYLLDANVLIQAKNLHYGFDFCPGFWDWLIANNAALKVFSIEKVGDELIAIADQLAVWASAQGPSFFLPPDSKLLAALTTVSTWATSQNYEPSAVSTFLQVADYYLVGHALAHGHTVVTPRSSVDLYQKDQDSRCLYRPGYQVHQSLPDVANGTRAVCARTLAGMRDLAESIQKYDLIIKVK